MQTSLQPQHTHTHTHTRGPRHTLDTPHDLAQPSFFSGYNELVWSSKEWNAHLPSTIEAFFVIRNGEQYSTGGVAALAHADFVSHFHTRDVPLLAFDPANFEQPFSEELPKPTELRECGVWCSKWTTQDENCNNCA